MMAGLGGRVWRGGEGVLFETYASENCSGVPPGVGPTRPSGANISHAWQPNEGSADSKILCLEGAAAKSRVPRSKAIRQCRPPPAPHLLARWLVFLVPKLGLSVRVCGSLGYRFGSAPN